MSDERIAALRAALEHIASPNSSVRATAQDARDMAAFARRALAEDDAKTETDQGDSESA